MIGSSKELLCTNLRINNLTGLNLIKEYTLSVLPRVTVFFLGDQGRDTVQACDSIPGAAVFLGLSLVSRPSP
jgi:hypothetical protein